jgi:hypothetical protein
MALGTPTVTQLKKSASAPLDVHMFSFKADAAYPAGGYADFQDFVRAALQRDVTVVGVKLATPLKDAAGGVVLLHPVYDQANDKLMFFMGSTGVEIANTALTAATDVILWVECI